MEKLRTLLLGLFLLLLLAVDWSLAESQPDVSGKTGEDPRNESKKPVVVSNPTKADKDNRSGGDIGNNDKTKEVADNGSGSQSGPKDSDDGAKGDGKGGKSGQLGDGSGDKEKKKGLNNEAGSNTENATKDKGNEGDTKDQLNMPKDEATSVDGDCDPSVKCTIKNKQLVACLRQSGHESPEFSLLVQNTAKKDLDIKLSGPDFVRLENKSFQLQGNHKQQVKVKLEGKDGGGDSVIVLSVENDVCQLNITDMIARISDNKIGSLPKLSFMNFVSRTPVIALASFAALLILASAWTCFSFRKKLLSKNGSKYQRVEMELPVSGAQKTEPEVNDGWDNNWGDEWDDEEAPLTPSIRVTPSPSFRGLASRRLNKEGWKN